MQQKRHFQRIAMDAPAELSCGDQQWSCQLLDISLKGALLTTPTNWAGETQLDRCSLEVQLDNNTTLSMQGAIVHGGNGNLGLRCDHIDIDSISHLKRLVELNLGDEGLLKRELAELSHSTSN